MNVSKGNAVLFVKTKRNIHQPRAVQFHGQPMQWVKTRRYLVVIVMVGLTWLAYVNQVREKAAQR
jgi:hypothetical protein